MRVLGQIARNLLFVLVPRKDEVSNGRIVEHDTDEFHLGIRRGDLTFKPGPLFASRLERRIGVQQQHQDLGSDRHGVPAERAHFGRGGPPPPVHETRARVPLAPLKLVVTKRRVYRNLRLRPSGCLGTVSLVVLGTTALINEIASDENRRRVFARRPCDQRTARDGVRHTVALSEASIAVGDECQWRTRIGDRKLEARRGIRRRLEGKHLHDGKNGNPGRQAHRSEPIRPGGTRIPRLHNSVGH